jgi:hypothetical protein
MRAQIKRMLIQAATKKSVLFVSGLIVTSVLVSACGELTGPTSPETPANVTATLGAGNKVTVSWAPSPQSDGVVSYNVMRNGTKVGESTTTSYVDTGLSEQTTYKYSVSANCTSGVLSDASAETPASTVTTVDVTPPRVISNIPVNGSTVVSTFATATVTFSEPMNPSTINPVTFNLQVTNGPGIPGTVTYNPTTRVAEFTPTSPLPSLANITATVTTGAKDVAGNGLAAPFSFKFTTIDQSPPFVLSTTPSNGATGVSTTAAITVTFSEAMAASTINSTNFSLRVTSSGAAVGGNVTYDPNLHIARFVPVAPLSELVNYTATVSGAVTDLAGNAMGTSFPFSFTTGDFTTPFFTAINPIDQATNVPTNVVVSATWSEPMDPTSFTATTFSLKVTSTGVAVPGTIAYDPATLTSTFTPTTLLAQGTNYSATLTSGVKDLAGNGLRVPFTWTFTTADVRPFVTLISPANGASGIATNTVVNITFSEAMDQASIVAAGTITMKNTVTGTAIPGTVTYNPATNVATFTPTNILSPLTAYTVTVSTAAKDITGNTLAAPFISTFTTAAAPDTTPPTVTSVFPAAGATNVPTNTAPTITFSEAMDGNTINGTTITLKNTTTGTAVAGTVSYNTTTHIATFTPTVALANGTGYTITVTTGVKDVAGNALATQFTSTFTTAAAPDTTPPTVTTTSPLDGATNVAINTTVTATFSEPMDAATITAAGTFTMTTTTGAVNVPGTVTYNPATNTATFTPTSLLLHNTGYTATITTAAKDVAGNAMVANKVFSFTTVP